MWQRLFAGQGVRFPGRLRSSTKPNTQRVTLWNSSHYKTISRKSQAQSRGAEWLRFCPDTAIGRRLDHENHNRGSHHRQGSCPSAGHNQNTVAGALAQAFKRACVKFGLDEYLYRLPKRCSARRGVRKRPLSAARCVRPRLCFSWVHRPSLSRRYPALHYRKKTT
jgi:hypothetical protein